MRSLFHHLPVCDVPSCSGVIVRHFEEIRETVKSVVLDTFFEPVFMQQYINAKTDEFLDSFHLGMFSVMKQVSKRNHRNLLLKTRS